MPWYPAEIAAVAEETPIDRTLTLGLAADVRAAYEARPGQYTLLRIPGEVPPAERAYSLSGATAPGGPLRITVRGRGDWGRVVYELAAGQQVEVSEARGDFVLDAAPGRDLLLIAGGGGVTPFRAFVEHLRHAGPGGRVVLLHSCMLAAELLFRAEFEAWAAEAPWFRYVPSLSDEPAGSDWTGGRGMLGRDDVAAALGDPARTTVYACGPGAMVEAVLAHAAALGVDPDDLRRESW